MKMESAVASPLDGQIGSIHVRPGDTVETGTILMSFKV
jgi:biotin carboxyl carrier protein